ncbi:MAG: hypothetical protein HY735_34575 [Verrucomicrobia bacterium]|nr:hypothetical protein [Verrucomicrobiota bacterium]
MSAAVATADSFSSALAEMARRNVESTLAACDQFRRWHRENFILKRPTAEQRAEHAMDVRILLLMVRWLQATLADPASPARELLPRVAAMIRLLEDCWQSVHEPMDEAEAEMLLSEVFPG